MYYSRHDDNMGCIALLLLFAGFFCFIIFGLPKIGEGLMWREDLEPVTGEVQVDPTVRYGFSVNSVTVGDTTYTMLKNTEEQRALKLKAYDASEKNQTCTAQGFKNVSGTILESLTECK